MAHSTLLSPLARLCYYPVPSVTGLPDWPQRDRGTPPVMTVSNYAAEARDYVRTLIELLGARFEGTMTKSTDYVVSATCVSRHAPSRNQSSNRLTFFFVSWRAVMQRERLQGLARSRVAHPARHAFLARSPHPRLAIRPADGRPFLPAHLVLCARYPLRRHTGRHALHPRYHPPVDAARRRQGGAE